MCVEVFIEVLYPFALTGCIGFDDIHIVVYMSCDAALCHRISMCYLYPLTSTLVISDV